MKIIGLTIFCTITFLGCKPPANNINAVKPSAESTSASASSLNAETTSDDDDEDFDAQASDSVASNCDASDCPKKKVKSHCAMDALAARPQTTKVKLTPITLSSLRGSRPIEVGKFSLRKVACPLTLPKKKRTMLWRSCLVRLNQSRDLQP